MKAGGGGGGGKEEGGEREGKRRKRGGKLVLCTHIRQRAIGDDIGVNISS